MEEKFKLGDRVEHTFRGKGIFIKYDVLENESIIEFDLDSEAKGDTLVVSTVLLTKITE